jgi:uncharacterized membrane protein YjjB (DUF3815 family)
VLGAGVSTLAFGLVGGAAARFLGGGLPEIVAAAAMAMLTGWLAVANVLPPTARRFFEPLAAFLVSGLVCAAATRTPLSTHVATLGPELGVFAGAFVAALSSNLIARRRDVPALVTLSPAMLLLVPGSVGFRSLALLLDREVVNGIQAAFRMILMFAALVAGLQVAGVALPAPRLRATLPRE